MTAPAPPQRGFDPEAEQEVDFAHYVRLLGMRWWLLAAGLVAGAVIGYLISLGGNQVYSAAATVYLGQPYTPSGGAQVTEPADEPVVRRAGHQQPVRGQHGREPLSHERVGVPEGDLDAGGCHRRTSKSGATINPLVKVSVQAKKGKVAACAANGLADEVVKKLGTYTANKIKNLESHIAFDNAGHQEDPGRRIANPSISDTDKLILQTTLRADQLDKTTNSQLLLLATNVESPKVLANAASHKITARSRRNTVVIAALIGLILGAIAALLWDTVVPRITPRNGNGD